MHGTSYTIYSATSMSINSATFAYYAFMYIVLKLKNRKTDNMFKPLMGMILIVFYSCVDIDLFDFDIVN
uniref:Serpentine receptor class gamma n=1 Tax=Panagrellus redivivus TaxID=6233 RepID=A0A7E4UUL1_PANRE